MTVILAFNKFKQNKLKQNKQLHTLSLMDKREVGICLDQLVRHTYENFKHLHSNIDNKTCLICNGSDLNSRKDISLSIVYEPEKERADITIIKLNKNQETLVFTGILDKYKLKSYEYYYKLGGILITILYSLLEDSNFDYKSDHKMKLQKFFNRETYDLW